MKVMMLMNRTMLGRSAGTLLVLLIAATALAAGKDTTMLFKKLGTHETGLFDEGGAEIVAHDPLRQRLFIVSANAASINVLSIRNPRNPIQTAKNVKSQKVKSGGKSKK